MKRIALVLIALLLSACSGIANHPPRNPHNLCDIYSQQKGWRKAVNRTSMRWGVPSAILMSIIYHESSFIAEARPPYKKTPFSFYKKRISTAYGYAQALDGTWEEYLDLTRRYGAKRNNFADAVEFVGWYSHQSYKRSNISKRDAYRLYLAYHEGHAGYNRASYRRKPWLLKVARRVQDRSRLYARQLSRCRYR
ncbi:MAG: hypothetical protein AAGF06_04590 [Pseudomonadota bacterium]